MSQANTFGLAREKDGKRLEGTFAEQRSQGNSETSCTNIFGLSGDINDKLAALVTFERGEVQNYDGTQYKRNAASAGISYVDKDRIKASSKIEMRLDEGQEDKRQYLGYNALEGKINEDTTLFVKANVSQTKNTTTDSTQAQYKEYVTGAAYRPVNFDRLNLLAKYTYLEDDSPESQTDYESIEEEKAHVLSGECIYDLTNRWQLSEKLALKIGEERVTGFDFTKTQTWLNITRLNYNINENWQLGTEYRYLNQKEADDYKQGALVELSRDIGEFIQVGVGYNFTDFNDDLTHLDYTAHGPFIRVTGTLYDRSPEEKRLKKEQKQLEAERKKAELEKKQALKREIDSHYNKALSYYRNKSYNLAIQEFNKILELNPQHKSAQNYLNKKIPAKIEAKEKAQRKAKETQLKKEKKKTEKADKERQRQLKRQKKEKERRTKEEFERKEKQPTKQRRKENKRGIELSI